MNAHRAAPPPSGWAPYPSFQPFPNGWSYRLKPVHWFTGSWSYRLKPPLLSGRGLRPQTITSPSAPSCPGRGACRKSSFCLWATATRSCHLVQLEEKGERWIGAVWPVLPAGGVSHTHVDSITPSLGQRGDQLDPYR